MNFSSRIYEKELLDRDDIPFADIKKNMEEIKVINTKLGGFAITLAGLKALLGNRRSAVICEIGCGAGDNLEAIHSWCIQNIIDVKLVGIDIKKECIEAARQNRQLLFCTQWICEDYRDVLFRYKPDIIFSSLFCHHFTERELVPQLQWLKNNCAVGFFINDLHRHWLAYYSIKLLTKMFSSSYLVKNDAPLSVARGFRKREWLYLTRKAGLPDASVEWKWAFRHLVTWRNNAAPSF